jgi:hypothetical protein
MTRRRTAEVVGLCGAVLFGLLLPIAAEAAWVGFRNDTGVPILVQGASVVNNNQLRRGRARLLLPGEVYWDNILLPGKKIIFIADAQQPTRILSQDAIIVAGADLFFSVQLEPPPTPPAAKPNQPAPKGNAPAPKGNSPAPKGNAPAAPPPQPKTKLVPDKPAPNQLPGMVPWK